MNIEKPLFLTNFDLRKEKKERKEERKLLFYLYVDCQPAGFRTPQEVRHQNCVKIKILNAQTK